MQIARPLPLIVGGVWAVQSASWPLAQATAATSGVQTPTLAWAAWGLAVAAGLLGVVAVSRSRTPSGWALTMTALAATALVLGGLATEPGYGTSYAHPSLAPAIGVGLALALVTTAGRLAAALAALVVAYVAGIAPTLLLGASVASSLGGNLATLVGVPAAAFLLAPRLRPTPTASAAPTTPELDAARAELAAVARRESERGKQYRLLHDTVLSTLASLSRGSLDPREPAVAQRLTADADYLRGLIATTDSAPGMYLVGELARIVREQASAGLRVHPHVADVPADLPPDVTRAFADALREALANVVKHAGRPEAWVTITGGAPGASAQELTVVVTDRGKGFDPATPTRGLGLSESIGARIREVGGTVDVDSAPGQGTSIELRWPAISA